MKKKRKPRNRYWLGRLTLCISTAMVLILLGLVVLSALTARNLSAYVRENIVVTVMFESDMTGGEAQKVCQNIKRRGYVRSLKYISMDDALREARQMLGADPAEFVGANPFLPSVELTLAADYANADSLRVISAQLKHYPKVSEIRYEKDLVDEVNARLGELSIVLLVLAVLLTLVSFSLINNTVRLDIYARRFTIRTMKLVGASWGFIRRPFVGKMVLVGLLAAALACGVLGGGLYALLAHEPDAATFITWQEMALTAGVVVAGGILLTALCTTISVNKYLRMTAGELYRI